LSEDIVKENLSYSVNSHENHLHSS